MKKRIISSVVASLLVAAVVQFIPIVSSAAESTAPSAATALPPGVSEVVKMYQSGVHKDVIASYVNNITVPCRLTADGILYLHSVGVPDEITQALIVRDGQLRQMAASMAAAGQASGTQYAPGTQIMPGAQNAPVVTPTTPPPDVSDYGYYGDNSYYGYSYPYYPYYYAGYPYGVWGWGWGGRGGYGRGYYGGFHGGFHGGVGGFHGGGFRGGAGGFHGGGFRGGFAGGHGGFGGGHGGGGHR
jgi:hypothetical protein